MTWTRTRALGSATALMLAAAALFAPPGATAAESQPVPDVQGVVSGPVGSVPELGLGAPVPGEVVQTLPEPVRGVANQIQGSPPAARAPARNAPGPVTRANLPPPDRVPVGGLGSPADASAEDPRAGSRGPVPAPASPAVITPRSGEPARTASRRGRGEDREDPSAAGSGPRWADVAGLGRVPWLPELLIVSVLASLALLRILAARPATARS
jgi:hypothetical protein